MSDDPVLASADDDDRPRVLDTYALAYAFILAFLLPGAISIARLPFRTYTFAYVAPVTLAFVFGLAATFFTDSRDGAKTVLVRCAVLTPLVLLTGVAVLFTAALGVVPVSDYIKPQYFDTTKWVANALLLLLASPLVVALFSRLRKPFNVQRVLQLLAIVFAVVVVAGVAYLSVAPGHELSSMVRKDVMIYIVGGLVWYLPSFGIAAGVWRKVGPV
jgi:hypothetical protein